MGGRLLLILMLLTIPGAADPGLFYRIHPNDAITLVLPNGHCEAKVVTRDLDELTVRLNRTTNVCGDRKSLVRLSRSDIWDVMDDRRSPDPDSAHCVIMAMVVAASTAGFAVGEVTGSNLASLSIVGVSGIAGALLCRERHRIAVFADRIVPAKP